MSLWSAVKGDAKKLWQFIASPTGQEVVGLAEGAVEVSFPAATGIIAILNKWAKKIFQAEAMAEQAGIAHGSGLQKAAIVCEDMTPIALQFAQEYGLPKPTDEVIASVNNDLVAIFNKLTGAKALPAPPTGAVTIAGTVASK
jgi:hypothetical protein